MSEADSDFVLFIDEAGDPGLRALAPFDERGSSEWFVLGAVLLRQKYEPSTVEWVRTIRRDINATQGRDLHFRKLSAKKRERACEMVAELPIRAFAVASHKLNMKGYRNPRAERLKNPDWFYNWCLRLLLERVTALVEISCRNSGQKIRPIRVVLAERGGHSYSQTSVYIHHLQQQARHGTGVLKKRQIVPDALDWDHVEYVPAHASAGAQLADVVSSAFFAAVARPVRPEAALPAKALKPIVAHDRGMRADFGLVLFPEPWSSQIGSEFWDVFRFYGHEL